MTAMCPNILRILAYLHMSTQYAVRCSFCSLGVGRAAERTKVKLAGDYVRAGSTQVRRKVFRRSGVDGLFSEL